MMKSLIIAILGLASVTCAAPAADRVDGTLQDRSLTVTVPLPAAGGSVKGISALGVDSFNGIPFAEPPVGSLRLRPPQKLSQSLGAFDGTGIAPSCPQMFISDGDSGGILAKLVTDFSSLPLLSPITGQEDCLTVTVQRPSGTKPGDKLPVLFWIFGGGFEIGSTTTYNAQPLLATAVAQGQPFIYVAVNYRVGGFGFMPGSEILKDGASNLGLLDQRLALQWVADNVASFGGDPSKVTIWGESAGSISVLDQMALYDGNATYKGQPLFRGAIMDSGSIVPTDPVDCPKGQAVYDQVVKAAGCSDASDSLSCLRQADYQTFLGAANSVPGILSYNSLALSYLPRPDGEALTDSPDALIVADKYHAVPMIIGDQEDEGTLFSLFQANVTTTDALVDYLSSLYFSSASHEVISSIVDTYPATPAAGSPFRTGPFNELYPGFKRLAAVLGDLTFTLARRGFLESAHAVNPQVPSWSYLSSYYYGTPILGTFHATDLLQVFYGLLPDHAGRSARTYYLNFLHNLDPNQGVRGFSNWPRWADDRELMWFESILANSLLKDDFRSQSYEMITKNIDSLRY